MTNSTVVESLSRNVCFQLFRKIISLDKSEVEDRMLPLGVGSSIDANIRRTHVYEDAFDYLSPQNGLSTFLDLLQKSSKLSFAGEK